MNRKKEIIRLISQYKTITGRELAKMIGCSLKTVQYSVKEINDEEHIINSTSKGYELNNNYASSQLSFDNDINDDNLILSSLLLNLEKIDIDELSDRLYSSRTSVERKLSNIKTMLSNYELKISRQKNKIWIEGKEKNKRALIANLIAKEVENDFGRNHENGGFLIGMDTNVIKNMVINVVNNHNYIVRECCMNGLMANITICLYRCRMGSNIEVLSGYEVLEDNDETSIATDIYNEYAKNNSITVKDEDISYLATLLKGQISPKNSSCSIENKLSIDGEFIESIRNIVSSTFQYYGLTFNDGEDNDFIYNFSLHVKSMIERARNKNKVENEMLISIQKNCPFIYDVAVYIYNKIKDEYSVNIINEEIGYIAVHIGFLIERSNKNRINILLLLSSYNGIDKNVKRKLETTYGEMVNIIEDPNQFSKQGIDLVILNQKKNIFGIKSVVISPFFDQNDQENISVAINESVKIKNDLFTDVVYATFLSDKLFYKRNDIKTKDQALKFMTDSMISQGIVATDFLQSVIEREELSTTCFFDSFAIPHGMRFGANKSRCSILISDEGIDWDGTNIHIVILIAVRFHDRHIFMRMYDSIIQSLQNEKKLFKVLQSNSIDEFVSAIKN